MRNAKHSSFQIVARPVFDGRDAKLDGPAVSAFLDYLAAAFASGRAFRDATAQAISESGHQVENPAKVAGHVYRNFLWTHFVCKPLMTAFPEKVLSLARSRFDPTHLIGRLEREGASIISAFHLSGYPLVAMAVATSSLAPLVTKARRDFMDRGDQDLSDYVVHLSERSAPIRMVRTLRAGLHVWAMVDVVLPSVRERRVPFLNASLPISAGLGHVADLSKRPCVPLFWNTDTFPANLIPGDPIFSEGREGDVLENLVSQHAGFISKHPTQWLEWYSLIDEGSVLRSAIKSNSREIWEELEALAFSHGEQ